MTDYQFIKTKIEDRIAVVTLDNPPVNILTPKVIEEIDKTFSELETNGDVKVVVFTTAGTNAFIAGADIKEIAQINSPDKAKFLSQQGQAVFNKIENSQKTNIAAIHGICVGGGNELVMAFHMRVAGERARFGQPEISLGIIPGFGGTQRLVRLVGLAKARELNLTGDVITAQEALRVGLVNRVVPDGELMKQTLGLAKKIASKSRVALELCEKAMHQGMTMTLAEGLALEADLFAKISTSQDMKEGIQAFLEKRQPKFQDK
ncbi:MAG: enoyl-CoA hydratase/isomerase family protein [Candidatus Omnitrophica bacterium]|nr:enoyl-CoA hydratase/isomerase family protein [Candidatus Omnitrophota bacterium]